MTISLPVADSAAVALAAPPPEMMERPAVFGGRPLFDKPLPIARPLLAPSAEILEPCRHVIESGRLTSGEMVRKLEAAAAQYLDVPECVAVSSCTSGLMLVERCLGLTGRVIVPSFTFFATAHSLLWNNLEPVLVDCDERSWNLDPARVEWAIGPGVSAILAVHLYGNPADTAALERIAARAGLHLIVDAAHAFGAARRGRRVGPAGDAEVFSLSPTKLLVAGEGGLIATRSRKLAAALRAARNYGDAGDYDCPELGLNARLSEFHAALALAGLPLVERHVESRNRLAHIYEQYLGSEPGLALQHIRPGDRSTRKDFSISIDESHFGVSRRFLEFALQKENIEVRRYFDPPLHRQRLYRRYYRPEVDPLGTAERLSRGVLSLPIHPHMSEDDAARIARRIIAIRNWVREENAALRSNRAARPTLAAGGTAR